MINLGLVLEDAAVFFDDTRGDGESKAGAGWFGGEERIEEPLFNFGTDAFAGIGDFEDDDVGFAVSQALAIFPRAHRDCAAAADAVRGVLNQIDEHLLNLRGVGIDARLRIIFQHKLNAISRQLGSKQVLDFVKRKANGDGRERRFGGTRELEEVIDHAFKADEFAFNDLSVSVLRRSWLKSLLLNEESRFDSGEWSSDFVRDTGREHAEGGELFVALDEGLTLDQFDPQRCDELTVNEDGEHRAEDKQQA